VQFHRDLTGRSVDDFGVPTYRLYDLLVCSDWPLPGVTVPDDGTDVALWHAPGHERRPFEPGPATRLYSSDEPPGDGRGVMEFHRRGGSAISSLLIRITSYATGKRVPPPK
jgi:hypothetical protein